MVTRDNPQLFFPRSKEPLISVLIPTRNRPQKLVESMLSCINLAVDPQQLEFVLKIDTDDLATMAAVDEFENRHIGIKIVKLISPRGNGYADLHQYYHECACVATGDWLMLSNDDCQIVTRQWDNMILGGVPQWPCYPGIRKCCVLFPNESYAFFWMRREMFQMLGHLAMDCLVDEWVRDVCSLTIGMIRTPIQFEHRNDEVMEGTKSLAFEHDGCHIMSIAAKRQKIKDCQVVLNFMEKSEELAVWTEKPEQAGWHIWRAENKSTPVLVFGENDYFCVRDNPFLSEIPAKWHLLGD